MVSVFLSLIVLLSFYGMAAASSEKPQTTKVSFVVNTDEIVIPQGLRFAPELCKEDGTIIEGAEWTAKGKEPILMFSNENMYTTKTGSTQMTAKADGKSYKFKVSIPSVYTTADEITITEPGSIIWGFKIDASGIFSMGIDGDSVKVKGYDLKGTEEFDPVVAAVAEDMKFYRFTPAEKGTTKIIIKSGSKTLKTINIKVEQSAVE